MTKAGQIRLLMAAAVALGLLALLATKPAEAAFPGKNGKIAFVSNRDANAEVYTIGPAGGAATRITFPNGGSTDPAFSPDGTKIAFNRDGDIYVTGANGMKPDGTGARRLTTASAFESDPTWSADGTKIAFVASGFEVDGSTDLEIWVVNADGTGRTPLTSNAFSDTQPAWSPPGDEIAFVSSRTGDTDSNVYVMNADGTGQASITPNSPAGCSPNCYQGFDNDPTWSPDGSKIAYVHGYGSPTNPLAGGGASNIWTMDPTGANKTNVSNNPDTSAVAPAWSPDGTRIAYVGTASGTTNRDIHTMNADGTGQGVLQANIASDTRPDWQQDSIPPETTITSGPANPTRSTTASLGFVSSETGSAFECSLDGAAFASCVSPKNYTATNGSHTFRVRATDVAGNVDATPAVRTWTVDTTKPTISAMRPLPGSTTSDRTPTIRATVKDNLTNLVEGDIKLYVNGALISALKYAYSPSTDALVYNSPSLSAGKKTVRLVATDGAGNVGARSWSFTVR